MSSFFPFNTIVPEWTLPISGWSTQPFPPLNDPFPKLSSMKTSCMHLLPVRLRDLDHVPRLHHDFQINTHIMEKKEEDPDTNFPSWDHCAAWHQNDPGEEEASEGKSASGTWEEHSNSLSTYCVQRAKQWPMSHA